MNKIRNLRLCAGLLLVAIGIFFALTNGQKVSRKRELLIDLTADKIAGISWTDENGETLSFQREDGNWICKSDPSVELDQTEMNTKEDTTKDTQDPTDQTELKGLITLLMYLCLSRLLQRVMLSTRL